MIAQYIFLLGIIELYLYISKIIVTKGFNDLKVYREIESKKIVEGDSFDISIVIENNKRLPASYLLIEEIIPHGLKFDSNVISYSEGRDIRHLSKFSIGGFKRKRRTYRIVGEKRGIYLLKSMDVYLGDILATTIEKQGFEDYLEIMVCPKINSLSQYKFDTTNIQGDNTVRRWIHKDPLYLKGIREYNREDRMKDIHWKSTLKANKLMVKDYDYTSEQEVVIIVNIQCGDPHWTSINPENIEKEIEISVALAAKSLKENIPTGIWTNGHIISYKSRIRNEIEPKVGILNKIVEFAARIDTSIKHELHEYLGSRTKYFQKNSTYILVTSYLNNKDILILTSLYRSGYKIKIIYVGDNVNIPYIQGIETIAYKGRRN